MIRKTSLIFLTLFLFFFVLTFRINQVYADETIKGHYCYTYGDNETLKEAKELTRTLAIRNAVESYRTYIESAGTVNNFTLTNDIIQIISSGYLKNIKVLEHKVEGRTVCETIQASVSPQQIEKAIKQEVQKRAKRIEERGIDSNGYIKILSVGETKDRDIVVITVKIIRKVHSSSQNLCVFVTFYDSEGDEASTQKSCVFQEIKKYNAKDFLLEGTPLHELLYPGEIKSHAIRIPREPFKYDVETKKVIWPPSPPYKVWLYNEKENINGDDIDTKKKRSPRIKKR